MKVILMSIVDLEEDPMEAEVELPAIPRAGDAVYLTDTTQLFPARVDRVAFSACNYDRVEIWLRFDGLYDLEEVKDLMEGAKAGAQW